MNTATHRNTTQSHLLVASRRWGLNVIPVVLTGSTSVLDVGALMTLGLCVTGLCARIAGHTGV